MKNENLGKKATDSVTGFSGTVVGFCQYLSGCDQYLLSPRTEDPNVKPKSHWLDLNRLEFDDSEMINLDTTVDQGPDLEAPKY